MKWEKLKSPDRATSTNANFQFSFCELESLRPTFKIRNPKSYIQKSQF